MKSLPKIIPRIYSSIFVEHNGKKLGVIDHIETFGMTMRANRIVFFLSKPISPTICESICEGAIVDIVYKNQAVEMKESYCKCGCNCPVGGKPIWEPIEIIHTVKVRPFTSVDINNDYRIAQNVEFDIISVQTK
jgi:hypothetical protein